MFQHFRRLQAFRLKHLPCLKTPVDNRLIVEIGYHQEQGRSLTIKSLLLLKLGASATVRRRLQRLVNLGVVHKCRVSHDRRICHLEIDPAMRTKFANYLKLISKL